MKKSVKPLKKSWIWIFFSLTFFSILLYLIVRITYFLLADYLWYEKILAFLLLMAETFILVHSFGYFLYIFQLKLKGKTRYRPTDFSVFKDCPPLAIIVPSYKEPLSILRNTLVCCYNIRYPNKHIYLLDDTRYELPWDTPENKKKYKRDIEDLCEDLGVNLFRSNWHGAKAGKINDFLQFLDGNILPGFDYQQFESSEKIEPSKYLIIFDADMNPFPDFAEDLIEVMEDKPKLGFIQTPQYYTNFDTNRVANAAGVQQSVFYEYICEGKSLRGSMFCCGTNVLFRRETLMDIGGFDETSVTEDFATSLKIHAKGWESLYINRVLAFGMGPEDLGAYFKQQFRWGYGTIGILRSLPGKMWRNIRELTPLLWIEYFLSSSYFFIGWPLFILIMTPILYILFDAPSYFASPDIYILVFTPYLVITCTMFFVTLMQRNYKMRDILSGFIICAVAYPIYMKAVVCALLGIKTSFGITPKGGVNILSLYSLIPQLLTCLLCMFAIVWGLQRIYYESENRLALVTNVFWTTYNFMCVSFFLYFNHPEVEVKNENA